MTIYTITASNAAGSTTTPLTITVTIAPPTGLAYSTPNAYYTVDIPIPENFPTSTGGAPTTYTIAPDLPVGLALRADTPPYGPLPGTMSAGVISGTPQATSTGTYTVTATNTAGSTNATITITVLAKGSGLAPSGLSYSAPAPVYTAGVKITPNNAPVLRSAGQSPVSYSVYPPLPAGSP